MTKRKQKYVSTEDTIFGSVCTLIRIERSSGVSISLTSDAKITQADLDLAVATTLKNAWNNNRADGYLLHPKTLDRVGWLHIAWEDDEETDPQVGEFAPNDE